LPDKDVISVYEGSGDVEGLLVPRKQRKGRVSNNCC